MDGMWSGTTDQGEAVSFMVSSSGTQWSDFKLGYSFVATICGNLYVSFMSEAAGPGPISGGSFSAFVSYSDTFTGQFTSSTTATGTYAFVHKMFILAPGGSTCFYYLAASGTWSANIALQPPGTFSKLSPADAAGNQAASPTLSWQASPNATLYDYCYSTTHPCSNWIANGASTSAVLSRLTPESTYYWQVRARNDEATVEANGGKQWSFTVAKIFFVFLPLMIQSAQFSGSINIIAPSNNVTKISTSPVPCQPYVP
jgi:hypothetical protein